MKGDEVIKAPVKTLVKERLLDMPLATLVNGKLVKTWPEFYEEIGKTPEPEILQVPVVSGG